MTDAMLGLDAVSGRADRLQDASGSEAGGIPVSYSYLGMGQIVQETRGNGNNLSYTQDPVALASNTSSSGNDRYTGLDRWGEVDDQYWFADVDGSGSTLSDIQYNFDADGNLLSENDLVDTGNSKTFTYDDQNQLTGYEEGTMSDGAITGGGGP